MPSVVTGGRRKRGHIERRVARLQRTSKTHQPRALPERIVTSCSSRSSRARALACPACLRDRATCLCFAPNGETTEEGSSQRGADVGMQPLDVPTPPANKPAPSIVALTLRFTTPTVALIVFVVRPTVASPTLLSPERVAPSAPTEASPTPARPSPTLIAAVFTKRTAAKPAALPTCCRLRDGFSRTPPHKLLSGWSWATSRVAPICPPAAKGDVAIPMALMIFHAMVPAKTPGLPAIHRRHPPNTRPCAKSLRDASRWTQGAVARSSQHVQDLLIYHLTRAVLARSHAETREGRSGRQGHTEGWEEGQRGAGRSQGREDTQKAPCRRLSHWLCR